MVCSESGSSEPGCAALVGDTGGHDPFLALLTHSICSPAGQRRWLFHSALVTALSLFKSKKPVDNALKHMVGFLGCLYRARSWTLF